jgi:prevent-host-death family protein
MSRQVTITASEEDRAFGKLLKRIYGSDEHVIVERDGHPVAVLLSYQEYEQLSQPLSPLPLPSNLPQPMSLEEAFGSVTPITQPEDFAALHEAALADHVSAFMAKMNKE